MKRFPTALMWLFRRALALMLFCALASPAALFAQGVTTGTITGVVPDAQKEPVAGASVVAIHLPSGTPYETVTRDDGRFHPEHARRRAVLRDRRRATRRPHSRRRRRTTSRSISASRPT